MLKKIFFTLAIFIQLSVLLFWNAKLAKAVSIIRDAEIEKFLRNIEFPIFKAANLNTDQLKIYVVNDNEINAYVSGGQNIFVNSGLIRKYSSPDALIGVLAHETGHIAAGHLARSSEEINNLKQAMVINYLLGIASALAGQADAGGAIIMGGMQTYNRIFMQYSQSQEAAADKLGLSYLSKIQYPADGLIKLLEFFDFQQIGLRNTIDEFALSHPVSRKRIDFIKNYNNSVKYSNRKINNLLQPQMKWILVKLEAFIENPSFIVLKYKDLPNNDLKFYALAIANYRLGNIKAAISNIDKVINNNSNNGFLYELKAQFLIDSADLVNAIINYNKALNLVEKQDNALIKIALSNAIIALGNNDQELLKLAVKYLQEARAKEADNILIFRSLAISYKKLNDQGRSYLALADYNLIIGNSIEAIKFANLAKKNLPKDAKPELLHAEDILNSAS